VTLAAADEGARLRLISQRQHVVESWLHHPIPYQRQTGK
jgi:hypothetical protein